MQFVNAASGQRMEWHRAWASHAFFRLVMSVAKASHAVATHTALHFGIAGHRGQPHLGLWNGQDRPSRTLRSLSVSRTPSKPYHASIEPLKPLYIGRPLCCTPTLTLLPSEQRSSEVAAANRAVSAGVCFGKALPH